MDQFQNEPTPTQVEKSHANACFMIAGVTFAAAMVGLLLNAFLAEVMAVAGMLLVSLFYLSMGIYSKLTQTVAMSVKSKQGVPFDARDDDKLAVDGNWKAGDRETKKAKGVAVLDE